MVEWFYRSSFSVLPYYYEGPGFRAVSVVWDNVSSLSRDSETAAFGKLPEVSS